ncbi:MAG: chemotaxis protein CheW [Holophagaceae bacterium]|nr:chemotaxis protein CheW [Holophagaceae bacterium]
MTQYATFRLNGHTFGIEIGVVREIIKVFEITPVPRAARHIRGLINLRGQVVTIMDLGVRLGSPSKDLSPESHIVILKTNAELNTLQARGQRATPSTCNDILGLLVDAISDVVDEDADTAEPPPANVTDTGNRFLSGVINGRNGLTVLLKLEELINN